MLLCSLASRSGNSHNRLFAKPYYVLLKWMGADGINGIRNQRWWSMARWKIGDPEKPLVDPRLLTDIVR